MHGGLFSCCRSGGSALAFVLLGVLTLSGTTGCTDLFNPSFLNIFDASESGEGAFSGVDAPTGHVPILFKNNARIADNVFRLVIQAHKVVRPEVVDELQRENPQLTREEIEGIVQALIDNDPVNLEGMNVPPRVRLTIAVTNVDGGVQTLEFLDGLRLVRDESGIGGGSLLLPRDLTENTNDTFIVQCEIAQINIVRVDVFVPVKLRRLRDRFDQFGNLLFVDCFDFDEPVFKTLRPDEGFDPAQGQFGTRRNFDPRFFPLPLTTLQCGAVVIIELTGELALPFRSDFRGCEVAFNPPADGQLPAFNVDRDFDTEARIPGFYGIKLSVRN